MNWKMGNDSARCRETVQSRIIWTIKVEVEIGIESIGTLNKLDIQSQ